MINSISTKRYLTFALYFTIAFAIWYCYGCNHNKKEILGDWQGVLNLNGVELTIIMKIEKTENEKLLISIDNPEQGIFDLSTENIVIADSIKFNIPAFNSTFRGVFDQSKPLIKGYWKPPCCKRIEIDFSKVNN
jgi:hypothetical protein